MHHMSEVRAESRHTIILRSVRHSGQAAQTFRLHWENDGQTMWMRNYWICEAGWIASTWGKILGTLWFTLSKCTAQVRPLLGSNPSRKVIRFLTPFCNQQPKWPFRRHLSSAFWWLTFWRPWHDYFVITHCHSSNDFYVQIPSLHLLILPRDSRVAICPFYLSMQSQFLVWKRSGNRRLRTFTHNPFTSDLDFPVCHVANHSTWNKHSWWKREVESISKLPNESWQFLELTLRLLL